MTTNKKMRLVIATIIVALFVFSCENPMVVAILPDKKKKEQQSILKDTIEFTDASAEIAKTYGDPLFTNAVAATYLGTGAVAYSSSDEAVAVVNAQNGEVTIAGTGETVITAVKAADERYAQAEASYTLTVAKATLTITADNMAISYDTDIPEYTYAISGFAYSDTKTVISGTPALVCAYAKGDNAGSYPITFAEECLSAANYDFVYEAGMLSVGLANQAALSIVDPGVKTYGDAAFSLSTTGGTGIGKVTYTIVSGGDVIGISGNTATIKKAGSATVKAVKAGSGNYNHAESAALTLTIGKRNLSNVTVGAGGTPVYTGSAHTPAPTVTDGGASITASDYTVSGYSNNISVGTATITITAKSSGNYTGTQSGNFTIGKATLTVTAEDKVIAYGAEAPEYTYAVTGFVSGQNESVVSGDAELECEYMQNDPKGKYPITFTAENFTATNYRFDYEDGELAVGIQAQDALALTIEDDSLAIENGNITVTYGDANFTLTAEGGSGEGGVRYRVLSGTDVIGINSATGEVFIKKAGTATVGARKSSDDEYSRAVAEAVTITVGKRDLSNASVSVSGTYVYTSSAQEPTPTVTDGSLISGSDWEVFSYSDNTDAGTATVTITATDEGNYVGSVTEDFTIGKAIITVTANDESIVYNEAAPVYAYAMGGDTEAAIVSGEPTLACSYAQGNDAGSYVITVEQGTLTLDSANYEFDFVDGTLTVGKANPVVTWPSGLTASEGQTLSAVTLPGNGTSTPAGTFSWTAGGGTSVGKGAVLHKLTFTHSDANYESGTLEQEVTVLVYKKAGTASVPVEMIWIPAGSFMMGSPDGTGGINGSVAERSRSSNETLHSVTLTSGFYMNKYQVTQEQYAAVMLGGNPSNSTTAKGRPPAGIEVEAKRPVETVSWYDAIVFCNRLSIMEGLTPAYRIPGYGNSNDPEYWIAINSGVIPTSSNGTWNAVEMVPGSTGYRLPTEAQWEYACRAGTTTAFSNGNNYDAGTGYDAALVGAVAWFGSNSGSMTHEVGKKAANAWGLHDMHGNVLEWCWDWYAVYPGTAETDPTGPGSSGSDRVGRGGSCYGSAPGARSAYRFSYTPDGRIDALGFRVACP